MASISDCGSLSAGRESKNLCDETQKYVCEYLLHCQSIFFLSIIDNEYPLMGALLRE